jgi:sec-independent protein translocase protein TatC
MSPTGNHGFQHDDDYFKDTRMSFGEHIEELRVRLWKAITWLVLVMVIGFVLDGLGAWLDIKLFGYPFGIGWPMMRVIAEPAETAVGKYHAKRRAAIIAKWQQEADQNRQEIDIEFDGPDVARQLGGDPSKAQPTVVLKGRINSRQVVAQMEQALTALGPPPSLKTMSVTEAFMVYLKVSLVCGAVLASPVIFYQIWAFVAAGLYPHEKRYIHVYLPFSLGLFLVGVVLCQVFVMPRAVGALLAFNEWFGFEPDLRLNEWLSFAILLPLVFGLSFQTPLVMLFLERIGVAGVPEFRSKRKFALFAMVVIAMLISPAPDAYTLLLLWTPMVLLYELGIWLCLLSPRKSSFGDNMPEPEEMAGV